MILMIILIYYVIPFKIQMLKFSDDNFRHRMAKLPPSNMSSDHLEFRAMMTPPLIRSWPFFSQSSREGWMFFSHLSSYGSMR